MKEKTADILLEEKEKKAIENLKGTYWYVGEEGLEENIKIVLNLIESLIAENKELKEENLHWKGQYHLLSRKIDVIPKSKVEEKIKAILDLHYNEDLKMYVASVLQSLLGKE